MASRIRRWRADWLYFAIAAATIYSLAAGTAPAAEPPATRPAAESPLNDRAVFHLKVDPAKNALADADGRFSPTVTGGSIVADDRRGPVLAFGDGDKNGIAIKDDGKIDFAGGLTLDAWVYLDEPPPKTAPLALKVGSFDWDLANGKLNTAWLVFPTEPVATTAPAQYKYFPVGGDTINGLMNVPLKRWVRLTMAYDEPLGAVTTMIDGMVDRQRFRYRGPERLQCDGKHVIQLFQGFKNCRVASISLRSGRPRLSAPTLQAYVNPLPYQDKLLLTFDHIDPDLPLPIEATLVWEKPSGAAATLRTVTLDSHAKRDVLLDLPTWKNALHTLMVNATAGGRSVFAQNFRVASVKPAGPIAIGADRTIARDGKRFFPLMVYHAMPDDFAQLAALGFNVLLNDYNLNQHAANNEKARYDALLAESLAAAEKHGLLLLAATNSTYNKLHTIPVAKGHPALFGWYGADEPWGDLTRLTESYNTIKMLEPDRPVLIVQNNYSRLQETAQGADIVGTDPYPVPNVSLRAVADATRAARRAVSDRKPVWTVLPQYLQKVPTREELRCMAWLAIASGADGVGFFDWDERIRNPQTKELRGWYTKERPEQVEDLRAVLKELRAMEAVLLAPAAAEQPTAAAANPAIHVLMKESAGKRFLIVANDSRKAEEVTLRVADAADGDAKRVTEGGGDAKLTVRGGTATLTLPALGAAVFEVGLR